MFRLASLSVCALIALAGIAEADLRSFTHTYEYATLPEGKTALELWSTQGRTTWDRKTPQFFEQIVGVEHGITDHWDMAFYTVLVQVAGDAATAAPLHVDEVKLETRYRLADRGEWPFDTVLHLELSKHFGDSLYGIVGRVIVARDFDKLLLAANAISKVELGRNAGSPEPEVAWALGATYQLHPKARFGAEHWGALADGALSMSAGPAISLAPSSNLWVTITAGFGFTDAADAFSARGIIGIEL